MYIDKIDIKSNFISASKCRIVICRHHHHTGETHKESSRQNLGSDLQTSFYSVVEMKMSLRSSILLTYEFYLNIYGF